MQAHSRGWRRDETRGGQDAPALLLATGLGGWPRSLRSGWHPSAATAQLHPQVVAVLCRARGVALDARDHLGRTPLLVAAAMGAEGVVAELWARGAAIDCPDVHGWTGGLGRPAAGGPGFWGGARGRARAVWSKQEGVQGCGGLRSTGGREA